MSTSKEKQELVIKLKLEGNTYKQIQDKVGVYKNTIIRILKKQNMLKDPPRELTDDLLQKIQTRYDQCHNIQMVAKEFKVSYRRLKGKIKIKEIKKIPRKESRKSYYRKVKEKLIEYKGGKCQLCGYNKCTTALEFHHLNPSQKDFTISGGTKSFEKAKIEADKCILVCANCHREIHSGLVDQNLLKLTV